MLHKQGFTLMEMLATILIIGVLAAIAVPEYKTAVLNSRLSTVMSNVKTIANSLELYHLSMNGYPDNGLSNLDIGINGCTVSDGAYTCAKGTVYSFGISPTEKPVGGFLGNKQGLAYIQYLKEEPTFTKRNQRECWADSANELANRVCLNLEGVQQGTATWRSDPALDHTTAIWNVYILP
ncbi:type IV pilin protein [Candidatus Avelusimicrobium caledoniensis]|uniref:type IV pilin protein n=1 Tax=Candidatus Avelusimicrobium caledoniensis TaxID=3416220 RepID=UPI003D0CB160